MRRRCKPPPRSPRWIWDVDRYYHQKVALSPIDTKKKVTILRKVFLKKVIPYIRHKDSIFDANPVKHGSFYQGLKAGHADEFDFGIRIRGFLRDQVQWVTAVRSKYKDTNGGHIDTQLMKDWPKLESKSRLGNSRVQRVSDVLSEESPSVIQNHVNKSPQQNENIVHIPLTHEADFVDKSPKQGENKSPQQSDIVVAKLPHRSGYLRLNRAGQAHAPWRNASLVIRGNISPILVKRRLQTLLEEARTDLKLTDVMTVSRRFSGPAVTVNLNVTGHVMSVDLAPMAFLSIPFSDDLQWPEPGQMWPANHMVRRIRTEVGINPVAKYTDSWDGSFADAEMELIRDLDADGGSRKKVYRIVKTLNKTLWCTDVETAAISSYDIKNLWLRQISNRPESVYWRESQVQHRVLDLTRSLLDATQRRRLPHFFDAKRNLLGHKDPVKLARVSSNISCFLIHLEVSVQNLQYVNQQSNMRPDSGDVTETTRQKMILSSEPVKIVDSDVQDRESDIVNIINGLAPSVVISLLAQSGYMPATPNTSPVTPDATPVTHKYRPLLDTDASVTSMQHPFIELPPRRQDSDALSQAERYLENPIHNNCSVAEPIMEIALNPAVPADVAPLEPFVEIPPTQKELTDISRTEVTKPMSERDVNKLDKTNRHSKDLTSIFLRKLKSMNAKYVRRAEPPADEYLNIKKPESRVMKHGISVSSNTQLLDGVMSGNNGTRGAILKNSTQESEISKRDNIQRGESSKRDITQRDRQTKTNITYGPHEDPAREKDSATMKSNSSNIWIHGYDMAVLVPHVAVSFSFLLFGSPTVAFVAISSLFVYMCMATWRPGSSTVKPTHSEGNRDITRDNRDNDEQYGGCVEHNIGHEQLTAEGDDQAPQQSASRFYDCGWDINKLLPSKMRRLLTPESKESLVSRIDTAISGSDYISWDVVRVLPHTALTLCCVVCGPTVLGCTAVGALSYYAVTRSKERSSHTTVMPEDNIIYINQLLDNSGTCGMSAVDVSSHHHLGLCQYEQATFEQSTSGQPPQMAERVSSDNEIPAVASFLCHVYLLEVVARMFQDPPDCATRANTTAASMTVYISCAPIYIHVIICLFHHLSKKYL